MTHTIQQIIDAIPDKRVALQLRKVFDRTRPTSDDTALTAHAGGTQAAALALKSTVSYHEVTTVASAADSVALPPAVVGEAHFVKNSAAANAMQVFGSGTDTIDSVATGTGVSQLAGDGAWYMCVVAGNWISLGRRSSTEVFDVMTTNAINGGDSSLDILGQAAAQGGATVVTGGTSSTAGNAGGASRLVGGTPGSTGIGGAATVTGGVGGSASGAGGAVSMTGGAGTAGNAAGGAASLVSGAGQGSANSGIVTIASGTAGATGASGAVSISSGTSAAGVSGAVTITTGAATGGIPGTMTVGAGNAQTAATAGGAIAITAGAGNTSGAGGAITITSGAAGSTGVAGAINIAVGAATAGAGSSITITGGSGVGSSNAGGSVNLVPGAAAGTGIPGEIQVNGVAGLDSVGWYQITAATVPVTGASYTVLLAQRAYRVKGVTIICSSGSTQPTVDVKIETGTTAPGSGTSVLTGVATFSATANTLVTGNLTSTIANLAVAAGNRISVTFGGTVGSITGTAVSILLAPI